jgi:hypothetical protein
MVKGPSGGATDFNLFEKATGTRLGHYAEVVFVAPGEYHISVNNSRGDPIIIGPAEARVVTLGSIRAIGPDGKSHTVDVHDSGGRRLGSYGQDILLVPGTYRVGIHQSISNNIKVMDGAIAEIKLASIRALGPDGKPKVVDVYDARRRRLGSWGDDILLTPGDYRIGINQSISEIIGLEGGKVITIKLGAIQMKEGTLFDESGRRLGYYKGQLLLVPGIYALKAGKSKFENIEVKAGEVTILDQ